jgi:hypothetical protein
MGRPRKEVLLDANENNTVGASSLEALETTNEEQAIPKPTLPDHSPLDAEDRIRSLVNLMQQLPPQYYEDPAMGKQNLWAILRFEPTDEQLSKAREIINDLKRN